jgi:hypothetical protein
MPAASRKPNPKTAAKSHTLDDLVESVLTLIFRCVGRMLYACLATLCWLLVACCIGSIDSDALQWGLALVCALALAVSAALAFKASNGRVRKLCALILPFYGDWLRFRDRLARRRGNTLVRRLGLVRDADDASSYRVYWYRSSMTLRIDALPLAGFTMQSLRHACAEGLAVMDAADFDIDSTVLNSYTVRFFAEARLDALRVPRVLKTLPFVSVAPGHLAVTVGRSLDGDAALDFAGVSGVVFAGIPGAGKTSACDLIVAGLLAYPECVDVYVADGKGGGDW